MTSRKKSAIINKTIEKRKKVMPKNRKKRSEDFLMERKIKINPYLPLIERYDWLIGAYGAEDWDNVIA